MKAEISVNFPAEIHVIQIYAFLSAFCVNAT